MRCVEAVVRAQQQVRGEYRLLCLEAGDWMRQAKPGQFVHLQVPGLEISALRRPFSIAAVDPEGRFEILYKTVGRGTGALSSLAPGTRMNLIGPLGRGFPLVVSGGRIPVLIAGGYGVAPLFFLASTLKCRGIVMIGGRTADDILFDERFDGLGWKVCLATEDGSLGLRGKVTALFDRWTAENQTGRGAEVFACGPDGLMKAISDRARAGSGFPAWLSLDKPMGCGVGVCLACVQRLVAPDGSHYWGRVCRDGPVFNAREILWHDKEHSVNA